VKKIRLFTSVIFLSLLAVLVGACVPETDSGLSPADSGPSPEPAEGGIINVYVTDAPPGDEVTSIVVTVAEVQVHRALAEQEQSDEGTQNQEQEQEQSQPNGGEWITIDISEDAATFDLLEIKGIEQYLGTNQVEAGKYTQVRLVVDTIMVAFGGGELEEAEVSSGELKIVRSFDVIAGEATALVLDFDADRMVTVTGAGNVKVKPVIKLTVKKEKGQDGEEPEENGDEQPPVGMLEDTTWMLQSYGEQDNLNAVLEGTEITAFFDSAVGQVNGSAGCNSYSGGYEIDDSELSILQLANTEMACLEPEGTMDQEQQYLSLLQAAESYRVEDGALQINCGGQVLLYTAE